MTLTDPSPISSHRPPPSRRHRLLGVLPFLGVLLFVINAVPVLAARSGDWQRSLVELGVVYTIGWACYTQALDDVVDGSSTYMVLVGNLTSGGQNVGGILIGYLPAAQAFVAVNPVNRVVDSRVGGGKVSSDEERVVALGVPGFARAAVINVTITETEDAGFAAVYPAHQPPWPGNSNINWSSDDQNLANQVLTPTDPDGRVNIRVGGGRTHVVVDVHGYLL